MVDLAACLGAESGSRVGMAEGAGVHGFWSNVDCTWRPFSHTWFLVRRRL
jgi:hypothetical protein